MSAARALLLAALLAPLAACRATSPATTMDAPHDAPYVLVLGTAQDGGLPQIGCERACCRAAWDDPARRRLASSLCLADPRTGRRWLFDASPDLREQVERARGHPGTRAAGAAAANMTAAGAAAANMTAAGAAAADMTAGAARPPLFDGVFLTHAHMGHVAGLLHLGREAYAARALPLWTTAALARFLRENAPWELLVRAGHVELRELAPGERVELAPDLAVEAIAVPHRPEHSDTVAFLVRGPERTLLYLPDIDKWSRWERSIEELVASVDVALLDGTFYADGEVPGRSMDEIPHPFVEESLRRFAALPASERAKIRFTHLNHTNPAADEHGEAAAAVRDAGFAIAREGEVHRLGRLP